MNATARANNILQNQANGNSEIAFRRRDDNEKHSSQQCTSTDSLDSAIHAASEDGDKIDKNGFSRRNRQKLSKEVAQNRCQFLSKIGNSKQKSGRGRKEDIHPNSCVVVSEPISLKNLKDLASKHPNEILLSINGKNCGFMILIRQGNISSDLMAFLLISLGKACAASLKQNVSSLLNAVCGSMNTLLMCIQKYLLSFRLNLVQDFHLESLTYLTLFLLKFQQTVPSSSSEPISVLLPLLRSTCENSLKTHEVYDDVLEKLKEIDDENAHFLNQHTPAEVKKASFKEAMQLCEPPENFRTIPVLPNDDDMHSNAFLRPNIVEGKYSDTEQYLDIQFRLLREDYVKPLRDGIAEYLRLKKAGKCFKNCRDVRVYENVYVVKQDFVNGGMVHIAQFANEGFSKVKWEYSKRFLSGSLLCLSSDSFQTMLFASVAQRLPEQLREGLLLIKFQDISDEILSLSPLRKFAVVETSAYFEAYRHNLKALQELNEQVLPFKKYIVNVENTVESPQYLRPNTTYDMRPLLIPIEDTYIKRKKSDSGDIYIEYEFPSNVSSVCKSVRILDDSCWPSASCLNLDNSQHGALKAAITKEFTIIQGPPGTGKTYIGLRIVQLLLHNIDKWFSERRNSLPIFIVCFTNHALDQFLEGVMCFTNKIVRVGGRGMNETVSKFQLNAVKRDAIAKKQIPKYIASCMYPIKDELEHLKEELCEIKKLIQNYPNSVLGENRLRCVISRGHFHSLKHSFPNIKNNGFLIYDWLCIDSSRNSEAFHVTEVKQQKSNNDYPKTSNVRHGEEEGDGEADIEFLEAQRDIDSEEFAGVSFDIEGPEKEEFPNINDFEWQVQGGRKQRLKFIKYCLRNSQPLNEREANKIKNVWALDIPKRWQLYKFWLNKWITKIQEEYIAKLSKFKQLFTELSELRKEEDVLLLKNAHVVGMTTTGAAKYRDIMLRLNPQILIVEEAAEILESHVVTSLAPNTQHIILIGDHQQLRPSPSVHELSVKYDLNISLFERMIKNKMDCFRLAIQHRMRPEVADLIVPHIYSDLKNHVSVTKYENIKGVTKNVFFVTHEYSELHENDSKSKSNEHEAKFMIRLCKYFVLQGYNPSQITVLATYTGQLFKMKKLITDVIREVRFTVVDNFQGEENDIILISFVRSNEKGEIGFLNIINRVCVALSRAKKGLFCIGNFELLAHKSVLWKDIVNTLHQNQAIGPTLELVCQNHPAIRTMVSNGKDFESVPEGGCTNVCDYRLDCGHACDLKCHPYDTAHENIRCLKLCNKTCDFGHKCPNKCFEECGLCMHVVHKTFHPCGHSKNIFCYLQNSEECMTACEKLLSCGHRCLNLCNETCTVVCNEKTEITSLVCGHLVTIDCRLKSRLEELIYCCRSRCEVILDCGHQCEGNCYRCHQGRLHIACNQPCKRMLVCGHECKARCAMSCPPCNIPCENKCDHIKCPKKCGEPCEVCTKPCEWHCEHHKCSRTCGEICNRVPCNNPCLKPLSCGHPCIGFCGEPCPVECKKCDNQKMIETFGAEYKEGSKFIHLEDCNHVFEVSDLDRWMKINTEFDKKLEMKVCPKCKTVIRRNLRFGNIVKGYVRKVEDVKKLTFGNIEENKKKQAKLLADLNLNCSKLQILRSGSIFDTLNKILSSKKYRNIQDITTLENIFRLSMQLANIDQGLENPTATTEQDSSIKKDIEDFLSSMTFMKTSLANFIRYEFLTASEQQLQQLSWETHRMHLSLMLFKLINEHVLKAPFSDFQACVSCLIKFSPFGYKDMKSFQASYQSLARTYESAAINLSELEKQSILKAMNLTNWYQCPNGHVYCITDCGGDKKENKCYDCSDKNGVGYMPF